MSDTITKKIHESKFGAYRYQHSICAQHGFEIFNTKCINVTKFIKKCHEHIKLDVDF